MKHILLILSILLFAGCDQTLTKVTVTPASQATVTQLNALQTQVDTQRQSTELFRSTLGRTAASLTAITSANTQNPAGLPKDAVNSESTLASGLITSVGVTPDVEEQAKATARTNLILQGRVEEAKSAYLTANAENKELSNRVNTLQATIIKQSEAYLKIQADAEAERVQAAARLAKVIEEHVKAVALAKAEAADVKKKAEAAALSKRKEWIVKILTGAAVLCTLGAIAGGFLLKSVTLTAGLGGSGIAFIMLATLVSQPWFEVACIVVGGVVIIVIGVWMYLHRNEQNVLTTAFANTAKGIQEMKDSGKESSQKAWQELQPYLEYWSPSKSKAHEQIEKLLTKLGITKDNK